MAVKSGAVKRILHFATHGLTRIAGGRTSMVQWPRFGQVQVRLTEMTS